MSERTSFDDDFDQLMQDPIFASAYAVIKDRMAEEDRIKNALPGVAFEQRDDGSVLIHCEKLRVLVEDEDMSAALVSFIKALMRRVIDQKDELDYLRDTVANLREEVEVYRGIAIESDKSAYELNEEVERLRAFIAENEDLAELWQIAEYKRSLRGMSAQERHEQIQRETKHLGQRLTDQ